MPTVQVADQIFNSDYPAEAVAIKKRVQQDFDPLLGDRFKHPLPRRILEVQMQVEKEFLPEIRRAASAYYDQPMQVDPAHAPTPPAATAAPPPAAEAATPATKLSTSATTVIVTHPERRSLDLAFQDLIVQQYQLGGLGNRQAFSKKLVALAGGNVYTAIQCTHRVYHSSKNRLLGAYCVGEVAEMALQAYDALLDHWGGPRATPLKPAAEPHVVDLTLSSAEPSPEARGHAPPKAVDGGSTKRARFDFEAHEHEAKVAAGKLGLEQLQSKVESQSGRTSVKATVEAIRKHFQSDIPKCKEFVAEMAQRWQLVRGSATIESRKSLVLGHLAQAGIELQLSPHLKLTPSPKPDGLFENFFVPAYKANLAAGATETVAKTGRFSGVGQVPPEQFLSSIIANSQAQRSIASHQLERAHHRAALNATNDKRLPDYTPSALLACQAEPGKFTRIGGVTASKMRVLVGWVGFGQTRIDFESGLTWQSSDQFEGPTGAYRAYSTMLDEFKVVVLGTESGNQRGWPFKKLPSGGNDKFVWVHPDTTPALATHIRMHPTISKATKYD